MESGHPVQGDILQVIPRRPSGAPPPDGAGTGSLRISLPPARRKTLKRVVFGALGACGLILVAAGIARAVRPSEVDTPALAATAAAIPQPTPAAVPASPPATAPAPTADVPQTGTLRLQRPAMAGKVWLDGQKLSAATATVACGDHQIKIGHGKAHPINIPCGGDVKIAK